MTSHKCGNCFFFKEAGFAGSGWCLNADRAQSADVRSLVRRNELACRNNWGASLWADPKTATETGAIHKRIDLEADRPAAPATSDEISFVVGSRDGTPFPDRTEDRIAPTAEDRIADQPVRPARPGDDWFGADGEQPVAPGPVLADAAPAPSVGGEDVVVGDITVRPIGHTGRHPLVDQIPPDITPLRPTTPAAPGPDREARPTTTRPMRAMRPAPTLAPAPRDPSTESRPVDDVDSAPGLLSRISADCPSSDTPTTRRDISRDSDTPGGRDALRPRIDTNRQPGRSADEPTVSETIQRDLPSRSGRRSNDGASHLPPGLAPAPVPAPVPANEMTRRASRPTAPDMRGQTRTTPQMPSDRSASPRPDRPGVSRGLPDQPDMTRERPAARRPASLPELPELPQAQPTADTVRSAGPSDYRAASHRADHADADRPTRDAPLRSIDTRQDRVDHDGVDPASEPRPRSASQRPPLPRQGTRPVPPPARTIPTVGEVRESRNRPRPTGPATGFDQRGERREDDRHRNERPARRSVAGQRQAVPAAVDSPRRIDHMEPEDDRSVETSADLTVDQLLPPIQLRPEMADYGQYGDWMKLDPVAPRLAPDLARRCETCRDFRPAADGERGWCANRDAFTVRKVVYADELPCMNSFGCWWVPFDDIWLSEASVREHRNPTPLLDQLMPNLHDWGREDRRRGS